MRVIGQQHEGLPALIGKADTPVAFISPDPFRGTPAVLSASIDHFNPRLAAPPGPRSIEAAGGAARATYEYTDPVSGGPLSDGGRQPLQPYTVNHAAGLYVFGPHARDLARILPPYDPERLDDLFRGIRKPYE